MFLGQSPAVKPIPRLTRAEFNARRDAVISANNAARERQEDIGKGFGLLGGVLAAKKPFDAGDYPNAALSVLSGFDSRIGRGVKVIKRLEKGDVFGAGMAVAGFAKGSAIPVAIVNIGQQIAAGNTEEAVKSGLRTAAVVAFGPVVLVVEAGFNFLRSLFVEPVKDQSVDAEITEAEFAELISIEKETQTITRISDAQENSSLPGQFIGEGEPVPVNVLAAVPAISDTGESGYTPIASIAENGEVFYDEDFLPIYDEVIDAIVESAAAAEESGEYPAEGFLEGEWQLPVISSLPVAKIAPYSIYNEHRSLLDARQMIRYDAQKEKILALNEQFNAEWAADPEKIQSQWRDPENYSGEWKISNDPYHGISYQRIGDTPIGPSFGWGEPCIQYDNPMTTQRIIEEIICMGGSPPPYTGLFSAPSSPYTGPYSAPSSPYRGPSSPSSPYSGPSSPSSPYSGVQTVPALPASSGGSIVPGTGDPVKRPFPWWIVIATVILS